MRFVSGAESVTGQNLVACQVKDQIYFYTIKPIMPDQELLVWYCKEFAERLNYSVNGELMEKKIRKFIFEKNRFYNYEIDEKINQFFLFLSFSSFSLDCIGEQLLSDNEVDSSSNMKRENHVDSNDDDIMCAPCPSSLIKESLKRNITARLSLNHQTNSSETSPLENLNLVFTSLQKSTNEDNSSNQLSNLNSHSNSNSNGKLSQTSSRNNSSSISSRTFNNNSNDVCALSNPDEHRTDEGYHSNGGQDELTPPDDSTSEDSDSENNYVLDFSVKGTSTKVLVEQKKEELEVN